MLTLREEYIRWHALRTFFEDAPAQAVRCPQQETAQKSISRLLQLAVVIFANYSFIDEEGYYNSILDQFTRWDGQEPDLEEVAES